MRTLALAAAATVLLGLTGCTSEPVKKDPRPDTDPVATSTAPATPDHLSTVLQKNVDAALSAYEPNASLAANVTAMQATVQRLGPGMTPVRADVVTVKDRPVLVSCAEHTSAGGSVTALEWTTYFTPDGVASESATGASCKAIADTELADPTQTPAPEVSPAG